MLHTKFCEFFEGFLPLHGHGDNLGHVTQRPRTDLSSPYPWRIHTNVGFDWLSGFGEDNLKLWTDDNNDGRRSIGIL